MAVQVNVTIDFSEAARQVAAFQQELGQELVATANQSQQAFQRVAQEAAQNVQRQAAQITQGVQGATQGATQAARTAGKNMTEEFLRAFDPTKIRAELEAAGLDEQQIDIIINTTQARAETQQLKDAIAGAFGEASDIASESLKQITAQAAREVDRAAGKVKSVTEIVDGVRDLTDEVKKLDGANGEAAQSLGMLVLNETVDKFGDLKDIFEKSAGALLGLSEEAVEATVRVADLAEKGAMVGAAFGPLGATIGLVAGGALGFFVEKINESKKATEETEARIATYQQRIESLKIAEKVAISQEQLTKSIEDGRLAAETNSGAVKILYDAQTKLNASVKASEEELSTYRAELVAANEAYQNATTMQEKYEARQKSVAASNAANIHTSRELAESREELRRVTVALTIVESEQQKVAIRLAKAQALQAVDTLDAANEIRGQLLAITEGSAFAGQKTESLQKEYDKLKQTLGANANAVESLALQNLLLGESTDDATAAIEAQAENEAEAINIRSKSAVQLERLAELEGELKTRKAATTSATSASTKATKDDTTAKEDNAKATQAQIRALFEAEKFAESLAGKTKFVEDAFVIEPKLKIPPLSKEDMALALPSLDFASFVDITKYIEQFESFAVDIQDIFREQFEDKALNLSVAVDPESQKKAEQDLQNILKNAEQVEKQRQEARDYASKMQNERKLEEAKNALEQAENLLAPIGDLTTTILDTLVDNVARGESAFANLGSAIRDSIINSLKAIGKEYLVKALGETAEGIASLAIGGPIAGASAAQHFKAAAGFAAAAVAAGAGAAAIGAATSPGAIPSSGGGSASAGGGISGGGSASLGGGSSQSQGPAPTIVVDFRGAMFPTTDLRAAQEFGAAVAGYLDVAFRSGATSQRSVFRR